jgi:hypothetical protein
MGNKLSVRVITLLLRAILTIMKNHHRNHPPTDLTFQECIGFKSRLNKSHIQNEQFKATQGYTSNLYGINKIRRGYAKSSSEHFFPGTHPCPLPDAILFSFFSTWQSSSNIHASLILLFPLLPAA